ncbi:helix-turn-helix transcriptional regulator [Desulfobulbus sp.]|uniref:helix-turn-helix domain-containing protein n=1 Tax=Desulfobulbus sp. TaxID=895 RepID=UPI00286EBA32|nr:helix-turn-helix transcriptional regulator [Desulfobulbus sp.]
MTVLDPVVLYLLTCGRKKVTLDQVTAGVELERKPVLRVLDKLACEGYLQEIADNKKAKRYAEPGPHIQNPTWEVVRDLTDRPTKRPKKDTGRDRIWRAIKRLQRGFTRSDLVRLTGASRGSVDDYTKLLVRDGYIRVVGLTGRQLRYNLASDELKRPKIKEQAVKDSAGGMSMENGWLQILRQRTEIVGRAEVAREMAVSPATISLLLSGKYPASTEQMQARVMKIYGRDGKVSCPVLGEIEPGKCAELWNKAKTLGVKGSNASMIRQRKACLKCKLRSS